MGYFSNASEGEMYQEDYCLDCKNFAGNSCPIWQVHMIYNYNREKKVTEILDILIPRKRGYNDRCSMFIKV